MSEQAAASTAPPTAGRRRTSSTGRSSSHRTHQCRETASNIRHRRASGSSTAGDPAPQPEPRRRARAKAVRGLTPSPMKSREGGVRTLGQPWAERLHDRLIRRCSAPRRSVRDSTVKPHATAPQSRPPRPAGSCRRRAPRRRTAPSEVPASDDSIQHTSQVAPARRVARRTERWPASRQRGRQRRLTVAFQDHLVDLDRRRRSPARPAHPPGRSDMIRIDPDSTAPVASATSTEPPSASAHNRLASIAAAPIQSSPSRTMSPAAHPHPQTQLAHRRSAGAEPPPAEPAAASRPR